MNIVGLIVEYNPLHNGHAYHFAEAKRLTGAEAVIAVMSGDFLQRGEPALVDKWARAEMALRLGVDVVLELPVAYAAQPAEWFAYGAVALLDATGLTTHLCFGSEAGALTALLPLAERLAEAAEQGRLHEPGPEFHDVDVE
ncbi:MAG: nucleotidyltransferase family protein, partial [Paenibacillus sp.]|uniref:nucleotidyltransferase family protein n=1 Tax=Paenibacillus sp. TaxID=58172 RepID=UPI00291211C8